MGNDVSRVINTASHVQKVVNSVVNPGIANIVGTVAGPQAAAVTAAIGETVSSVTSVDGAAAAVHTAVTTVKKPSQSVDYENPALIEVQPAFTVGSPQVYKTLTSGGTVFFTDAMSLASKTSTGTSASLAFSTRLMRNIQRPEVLASSVAGGVAGVLGADNGGMRLFLGVAGAAVPPIAYTALT